MIYKILTDYPGYEIYENGDIFSFSTKRGWLKPGLTKDGYKQVNVKSKLAKNGYRHSIKVHRLVALAFVDNSCGYKEVNHIDGNKLNNHSSNLEWCSRSRNIKHAYDLNLRNSDGSRNASSKISEWQVKAIRFLYKYYSYKQTHLAEIYGITQAQVSSVILRKSWSHV